MTIQYIDKPIPKRPYIDITCGMSGHFAVAYWWNPEMGGFFEPWTTGLGRYRTEKEAYQEAMEWAIAENCPLLRHPELEN